MNPRTTRRIFSIMISTIIIVVLCSPLSYGQSQRAVQGAATKRVPVQKKEVPVDRQMAKDMLYLSVRVEAVQTWPINICEGTWQARISNPQGAPIGEALAIPYQYSSSQNKWLEGPAVQFDLGAGQKVTVQGQWKHQPSCKEFKVAFKPAAASKTYAEKSVRFPATNPSLAIERFEIASEYVAAHIRNGGQAAACNVSVQRLWASKEDPNQFTPDGGAFYSLPGNRTTPCKSFRDMSTWREGKDLIKIKIYGENSRVIAEKVFPIQQ